MAPVLGALFALLIGLLAVRPIITYEQTAVRKIQSAAAAGELKQIADAAQAYIQANYAAVEANSTPATPATITVPMLQATGYLPAAVTPTNPFGQTWVVQVLQPAPGQLQALVLSVGGQAIPQVQAPAIAAQAGQEGGFVPYASQYGTLSPAVAQGAYGHWSVSLAGYSNPGAGHLAALLAFNNGSLQNDYLYRIGVPGQPQLNTMATTLNMGGNNIQNANNIQADTEQLAAGAPNGQPGALQIGSTYVYGDSANAAIRVPGNLFIQNQNGTAGADINTRNMWASGQVQGANVSATTEVYAGNELAAGGGFWATQNGYAGVSDTLSVGSRIELGTAAGAANPGWGCSPNGEIAAEANGSGTLMACVGGVWKPVGNTVVSTYVFNTPINTIVGNFRLCAFDGGPAMSSGGGGIYPVAYNADGTALWQVYQPIGGTLVRVECN